MKPDPRVSTKVLACRDCGAPLQIVCPTHGHTVSRIVDELPRVRAERAPRRVTPRTPGAPKAIERLLDIVSNHTPSHPCNLAQLAQSLGTSKDHVSVLLVELVKNDQVVRCGRGRYHGKVQS